MASRLIRVYDIICLQFQILTFPFLLVLQFLQVQSYDIRVCVGWWSVGLVAFELKCSTV